MGRPYMTLLFFMGRGKKCGKIDDDRISDFKIKSQIILLSDHAELVRFLPIDKINESLLFKLNLGCKK